MSTTSGPRLKLGYPKVPFPSAFLGEGSPTKIDYRKKIGYPYSNLSPGGPRKQSPPPFPSKNESWSGLSWPSRPADFLTAQVRLGDGGCLCTFSRRRGPGFGLLAALPGSPSSALLSSFLGEGSLSKIDCIKNKLVPLSATRSSSRLE